MHSSDLFFSVHDCMLEHTGFVLHKSKGHVHRHITSLSACKTRAFRSDNLVMKLSRLGQFDQRSFSEKKTDIVQRLILN